MLDAAVANGRAAIELRGITGEIDLTKAPELQGTRLAETRQELASRGLVVSDLGASAEMHVKDPAARDKQLDEGRRFIDLAHAMGVPLRAHVRQQAAPDEPREEVLKRVVDGFQQMAGHAKTAGVSVLIESHGDFTSSPDLLTILTRVGSDAFALLWDAHHTFVAGKESPEETWKSLGRYVRHTHLKDSVPQGEDRRYVLTGTGQVPVKEQVQVLARGGTRATTASSGRRSGTRRSRSPRSRSRTTRRRCAST